MKIAIAIEVHSKHVEDVQVFKSFDEAKKSVEDWDGDAYNGELPAGRYRGYPLVNGEWHVQEIEVPE